MSGFDWSEPAIRHMVEMNHEPREVWNQAGILVWVHCRECGHDWPCPTLVDLRAWKAKDDPRKGLPVR